MKMIHSYELLVFTCKNMFFILQRTAEEFKGFQRLFSQFLQGTSSTVQWDKVMPLPDGAVSTIPQFTN